MSAERVPVRRVHVGDVVNFDAEGGDDPDATGVWREISEIITASGASHCTVIAADANDTDAAFDVTRSTGVWRHRAGVGS